MHGIIHIRIFSKYTNSFAQKISCIKIFLKNKFSFEKFSLKKTNIKSQWSNKTQLIKFCPNNIPKCFLKNKFSFEKSSLNNVLSKENKLNEWHSKTPSIILLLKKYHVSKFFSKIHSHLKNFQTKWHPVKCHILMIASMILNN